MKKIYSVPALTAALIAASPGIATGVKDTYGAIFNRNAGIGQVVQAPQNRMEEIFLGVAYAQNQSEANDLKSLDSRIVLPNDLTPERLREFINDKKTTLIYWRIDGASDNIRADRFLNDILKDYGDKLDKVVLIEGKKYGEANYKKLKDVLNEVNKSETESAYRSPIFSIAGFGTEIRIRGPPKEPYETRYNSIYKPRLEKFLLQFDTKKKDL